MGFVGIDRCRNAWLVAQSEGSLAQVEYRVEESLGDSLAKFDPAGTLVVVDVPIGLPVSQSRAVDLAARRLLGSPRASSVFPVPMRSALAGRTYEEASALNYAACGKKLPVQAFGMLDGIRDLNRFMTSERQAWVREGHPEVTFAMLSGGVRGLTPSKKSTEGEEIRLALLGRHVPPPDIDGLRRQLGRGRVAREDVLDVLAMLVSAFRLHQGTATVLPEDGPELDSRGLRMEMVA